METRTRKALILLSPNPHTDFNSTFNHLNNLISTHPNTPSTNQFARISSPKLNFSSTTLSNHEPLKTHLPKLAQTRHQRIPKDQIFIQESLRSRKGPHRRRRRRYSRRIHLRLPSSPRHHQDQAPDERGIGDLQRRVRCPRQDFSAVIVGSTFSSAVYFGTCEFGKSILSRVSQFPPVLIPPTSGAMGNIVSSAIMVQKELITQRMQAGAKGTSWEVVLRILEKDGILGLYAGYSATLLRNLPAGVLSYSSFEYLKAAVLRETKRANLEPFQSVCCGALAGRFRRL